MKRILVLWQSKYGSTQKYAHWLAQRPGWQALPSKGATAEIADSFGGVVLAGGLYAAGVAGLGVLKQHHQRWSAGGKRLAVGASPFDPKDLQEVRGRNLSGPLGSVPMFYGRGGWDEEAMTLPDRMGCRLLRNVVARKKPEEMASWEKALMQSAGQKMDWTDPAYLEPLITYME